MTKSDGGILLKAGLTEGVRVELGVSMGIGMESVGLGIALMSSAVGALEGKKQELHFPEGAAIHGSRKMFHRVERLWLAKGKKAHNELHVPLRCGNLPLGGNRPLQSADALVGLLQPDRLAGLDIPQRLRLKTIQFRSQSHLIAIKTP